MFFRVLYYLKMHLHPKGLFPSYCIFISKSAFPFINVIFIKLIYLFKCLRTHDITLLLIHLFSKRGDLWSLISVEPHYRL